MFYDYARTKFHSVGFETTHGHRCGRLLLRSSSDWSLFQNCEFISCLFSSYSSCFLQQQLQENGSSLWGEKLKLDQAEEDLAKREQENAAECFKVGLPICWLRMTFEILLSYRPMRFLLKGVECKRMLLIAMYVPSSNYTECFSDLYVEAQHLPNSRGDRRDERKKGKKFGERFRDTSESSKIRN